MKEINKRSGASTGKTKRKTPEHWEQFRWAFEKHDLTKRGWVGKIRDELSISTTQVYRIARRLNLIPSRPLLQDAA